MIWQEYFHEQSSEEKETPIFKLKKTNLPKKYTTPEGIKTYLGAVKSEIMDPLNRNEVNNNMEPEEKKAIKELIQLQKDRIITIKPCDKGAGIIILDFPEYKKSCDNHHHHQSKKTKTTIQKLTPN